MCTRPLPRWRISRRHTACARSRACTRSACSAPSLQAVHLTQLTSDEIALLGEQGVQVLHCPESNLKLASGFCPVSALLDAGCRIAVGTDGAASNNDLDMFGELALGSAAGQGRQRRCRQRARRPGPAHGHDRWRPGAGHRPIVVGSLEIGKRADIICVEPDLSMLPMYDPVSQLVYCASRDRVSDVWVDGIARVRDRAFTQLDPDELTADRARLGITCPRRRSDIMTVTRRNAAAFSSIRTATPIRRNSTSSPRSPASGGIRRASFDRFTRSTRLRLDWINQRTPLGRSARTGCRLRRRHSLAEAMAQAGADVLGIDLAEASLKDRQTARAGNGRLASTIGWSPPKTPPTDMPGTVRCGDLPRDA